MNRAPARRPKSSPLLAALALLLLAAPRAGVAGCHLGLNSGRSLAVPSHLDNLAAVGALAGLDDEFPAIPAVPPCPGGLCSSRPTQPIVPPIPASPRIERNVLGAAASAFRLDQPSASLPADDGSAGAILLHTRLERPPRPLV